MQRAFVLAAVCAGGLVLTLHGDAAAAAGVPALQVPGGANDAGRSEDAVAAAGVSTLQSTEADRSETVELNTATAVELRTLPGVGERTAQRIIEYREEHGGFDKVEDLMNVRGIGERTFLRLRPLVRVDVPASR